MKYPSEKVLKDRLDNNKSRVVELHLKLSDKPNGLLRSLPNQYFLMTLILCRLMAYSCPLEVKLKT